LQFAGVGQILLQIAFLFAVSLLFVRLMGNRTVGQLSPFDFIIMVGIGDIIVTTSMDKNQTLLNGVGGLTALFLLQQLLGFLSLKSTTMRKWFEGTPVTLIKNGKLIKDNFAKTQFNYDDLRQELHRQGMDMTRIADIQVARLESCGVFSVVKRPEKEPLTKQDLEQYIAAMYENPLSPLGQHWLKVEQLLSEMQALTSELRKHQPTQHAAERVQSANELH
jgi:uncharacterized membrane protein YcaP (DUF421 family)